MTRKKQKRSTAAVSRSASVRTARSGTLNRLPARFQNPKARAIVAGAAVALVVAPASWMMVNAQIPDSASSAVAGSARKAGGADGTQVAAQQGAAKGETSKSGQKKTDAKAAAPGATDPKATTAATAGAGVTGATTAGTSGGSSTPPPPAPAPPPPPPPAATGWHNNVVATIFWVGEAAGADNANISNAESAWDGNWQTHYGGYDDPNNRNGYYPAGFTPLENPFYFALPYNDLDENGNRKPTAGSCPNTGGSVSWCKNAWIKIVRGGKTAYAQWQDVGPLNEDDVAYVFGTAAPANTWGAKAGLDVSPAVRDYLGLTGVDLVSWKFVSAAEVPAGPWKQIVTTSAGGW